MGLPMKKVKQQDIADALGISRITVSKALNNKKGITEKMRGKVLIKAHEMGYSQLSNEDIQFVTQSSNSNLLYQQTRKVICLFTYFKFTTNTFWAPIISSLASTLGVHGYDLSLCFLNILNENEIALPNNFDSSVSSGIILMGNFTKKHVEYFKTLNIPLISIDTIPNYTSLLTDTILCENKKPIIKLVNRLIEQGHTRIGYIGPLNICHSFEERYKGYVEAMNMATIPILSSLCLTSLKNQLVTHDDLQKYFARLEALPTAIICCNDANALKLSEFLENHKLNIAVCGFDNLPEAAAIKLTTVDVPKKYMGIRSAEQIIWRINNPKRPFESICLHADTIFRKSSDNFAISQKDII